MQNDNIAAATSQTTEDASNLNYRPPHMLQAHLPIDWFPKQRTNGAQDDTP